MNQHSNFLFNSPARVGLLSVLGAALLILLPATTVRILAQQAQAQKWSQTGSLGTGRFIPTATLLTNGIVLVVGGTSCAGPPLVCQAVNSPEIYDPATGNWSATGNMASPRTNHFAVRLGDGKVLVGGGVGQTRLNTVELYDPDTGSWTSTGDLITARASATATLLANGKVLVAGGAGPDSASSALDSAELYDPVTGSWSTTGIMNEARNAHTATLLTNGKVLVASGFSGPLGSPTLLSTAELYDPDTGSWTPTGSLGTARPFHTATLLANGQVLAVGGSNFTSVIYDTSELYEPATGLWSETGRLVAPRMSHTATLLATGKVLVAAGSDAREKRAELYDTATGNWSATDDLNVARLNHVATLLADGRVLVVGGNPGLTSAELFDSTIVAPQIAGASVSGKNLFVEGHNFDEGAKVYLNDEKQKTANESPTTLLRCKKAGKKIGRGETVRLKVRNSDGTESAEFSYTRPVE